MTWSRWLMEGVMWLVAALLVAYAVKGVLCDY